MMSFIKESVFLVEVSFYISLSLNKNKFSVRANRAALNMIF